jgi:hypothetical protein
VRRARIIAWSAPRFGPLPRVLLSEHGHGTVAWAALRRMIPSSKGALVSLKAASTFSTSLVSTPFRRSTSFGLVSCMILFAMHKPFAWDMPARSNLLGTAGRERLLV